MSQFKNKTATQFNFGELFSKENSRMPVQSANECNHSDVSHKDIAIIGMSGQFGRAARLEDFWDALCAGEDMIRELPTDRKKWVEACASYLAERGIEGLISSEEACPVAYMEEIDKFDYDLFSISPNEAKLMDPNQRLFLQCAYSALENAGYGGEKIKSKRAGVYVGFSDDFNMTYHHLISAINPSALPFSLPGNIKSIIASRLAYWLDLKGPSLLVNTACSSSLVAVHLACRAIRDGECDMAIAGGVKVHLNLQVKGEDGLGILSSGYRARTFDNQSDGTGLGEGVGVVVLKPLSRALADGDHVYAVIKGSSVNQDGHSVGITAPNTSAQIDVIERAWKDAEIDPESITYMEAHGTGTKLGDPIEVKAIQEAFAKYTSRKQCCAIGSVKTNIGHLDSAAGIAGLIKAVLALNHKKLPPHLHFTSPNERIDFEQSSVYVNDTLSDWEGGGTPRRCGVSSFGLSGTNCHIVLEEAPPSEFVHLTAAPQADASAPSLLCLSAKSEQSLKALVRSYFRFFRQQSEMDVRSVCYTSATGREHHRYRLVIAVRDREDALNKLEHIIEANCELHSFPEMDIWYGEHKIVPEQKADRRTGEWTQAEWNELNERATACISQFAEKTENRSYAESAQFYVLGANIDWQQIYLGHSCTTVVLPSYPFEAKTCWLELEMSGEQRNKHAFENGYGGRLLTSGHPLLTSQLVKSKDLEVYATDFQVEQHWVLSEHVVDDRYVIPGTTYIEMVRHLLQDHPNQALELSDILFYTPLVANEGTVQEAHTILNGNRLESVEFSVVSRADNDTWLKHVEGKARLFHPEQVPSYDVEQMISRCQYASQENRYIEDETYLVTTGPRWRTVTETYVGDQEAIALLVLDERFVGDLDQFVLHPAMMDSAVNLANGYVGEGAYLPFYYEKLRIYGPMPQRIYSYVKKKDTANVNVETVRFDVILLDDTGNVIAEIDNYSIKKVHLEGGFLAARRDGSNLFHEINWVAADESGDYGEPVPMHSTLLIGNGSEYAKACRDALVKQGTHVVAAWAADDCVVQSDNELHFSLTASGFDYMFEWTARHTFSHVLFMVDLFADDHQHTCSELRARSSDALFWFIQSALRSKISYPFQLVVVSDHVHAVTGDEAVLHPVGAASFGMAKVIEMEHDFIHCRCFDIDNSLSPAEFLKLAQTFGSRETLKIAVRSGNTYIEQLDIAEQIDPGSLKTEEEASISIDNEGIYLITGGTSGIGLEIAKYMLEQGAKHVALLGRTEIPPRHLWESVIANEQRGIVDVIRNLQKLERYGENFSIHSVNVADKANMRITLENIERMHGSIRGIVHAAGVAGDGILALKSFDDYDEVLSPKINGTLILDELTQDRQLDFFVVFSTITTLLGGIGQADYTAANSFLDAFSPYRNKRLKPQRRHACTINWAAWKETGIAHKYGIQDDGVFAMLDTKTAVQAFAHVLQSLPEQMFVGAIRPAEAQDLFPNKYIRIAPKLQSQFMRPTREQGKPDARTKVRLEGRADGNYTAEETVIAQVWADALGLDLIDIYDNLYALGGDSIIAIQIVNALNKISSQKMNVSHLFEHLTIAQLAQVMIGAFQSTAQNAMPALPAGEQAAQRASTEMKRDVSQAHAPELRSEDQFDLSSESTVSSSTASASATLPLPQIYELSETQRRLWFLQKFDPTMVAYHLPSTYRIETDFNIPLFKAAVARMVERHWTLRTVFTEADGIPKQLVLEHYEPEIDIVHLAALPDRYELASQEIAQRNSAPFDENLPLWKMAVFVLGDSEYELYLNIHHLIVDGWGIKVFFDELLTLYEAGIDTNAELQPLAMQYVDWILQQEQLKQTDAYRETESYWLQEMDGQLPQLNLPLDYARPPLQTYNGDYIKFTIPVEITARLKMIAKEGRTTLHMLLLSSYFLFLQQLTGDRDMIVGITATRRDSEELEQIIGMFINMLCIRIRFDEVSRFDELVELVKRQSLQAYKHAAYPFETLVAALNPERDLARNAVFQTMFQFYELIPPENEGVSQFELSMLSRESDGAIEIRWEFNTDLFKRETVGCWTRYYAYMLEQLAQNPRLALVEIELLDKQELERLSNMFAAPGLAGELQAGAGTSADALRLTSTASTDVLRSTAADVLPASIGKWIERHAREQPDAIAVACGEECLTYRELNERANRLALLLRQSGARPNQPIALLCGRGIGLIVGLVGIVKSGGCYVPLDPDYPQDRLRRILSHCGSEIIVTEQACGDKLREMYPASDGCAIPHGNSGGPQVVRLDTIGALIGEEQAAHTDAFELVADRDSDSEQLMYIMYTSGSTGVPKGVMVTQRNVANFLAWSIEHFALSQADVMMSVTSASFDISVFEMFGALCSGAKLVIMPSEVVRDPARLLEEMECQGVTVWHSVPTLMSQVLLVAGQGTRSWPCLSNVRQVMLGGEAWSTGLALDIRRHFRNARITNMYGPTETTIWVSSYDIGEDVGGLRQLPIGRPIAGNEIQILNGQGKRCGIGVPGEIWIEGTNVTPGYYLDPEKTSQAFVRTDSGGWRYRTGDIGRYLADGNVEFLGRGEGFVKIRGYRIEPGEIENVLRGKEGIAEAVVTVRQETEGDQLACYYTGEAISAEELRSYVLTKLPAYMLPAYFTWLEQMPLTPNGKIDRQALPHPTRHEDTALNRRGFEHQDELDANIGMTTEQIKEQEILKIWKQLLNIDHIGIHDSFFTIGGNSFLIVQAHAKINQLYPEQVTVTDLFKYPTINKLVRYLEQNSATQPNNKSKIEQADEIQNTPADDDEDVLRLLADVMDDKLDIQSALQKLQK